MVVVVQVLYVSCMCLRSYVCVYIHVYVCTFMCMCMFVDVHIMWMFII